MKHLGDQLRVLDCTIRDGGLVNAWDFSPEFVRGVYEALSEAGVEYMEIGYKNSRNLVKVENAGPWAFLDESLIRATIRHKTATKLSALVDIGRVDERDILPKDESWLDLIRIACYIHQLDEAIDLVHKFHDMGYETSVNIMAVSRVQEWDLTTALARLRLSPVDIVYVVDSFGSLTNRDIERLVMTFQRQVPQKRIGIHTHNNLQMAMSNTLIAAELGATYLDSSIYGMGRAAGNCPTELLLGCLRRHQRYDVRPVLEVIERQFVALRQQVEWGYTIPYAITGLLDEHPRSAIALRNSPNKDEYVAFYDELSSPEEKAASR
ncbi:MAG: aldolase catalytic domain-containing protein [Alicyclobacillus sp.]|nr:aldolase catalytic domain-containing protein [Alicyclobacillus sp.]